MYIEDSTASARVLATAAMIKTTTDISGNKAKDPSLSPNESPSISHLSFLIMNSRHV